MREDEAIYRKKQWMLLFTCPLSASSTKRTPGSVVYRWPPSGTGALAAAASRLPKSVVRVRGATEDTCMSQRTHTYLAMLVPAARPDASASGKSSWNDGRTPSPDNTRVNLQEGCSIPTAGAASNGFGEGWPVAIAGTSIRAINSEPSPGTFSGCAVRR
jgi:hypothetical protein